MYKTNPIAVKTTLLLLVTLLTSSFSMGQSLEQSFQKLMADFKANPYAYIQANYAPDLRFIAGQNGEFRTKDRMIAPTTKVEDIQATDLKFFESGDLAVVSGINTTRYAMPSNQSATYKDAFTYTFRKTNGQWKHVAMQHTKLNYDVPGQSKADEDAIRKVIETETRAYHEAKPDVLKANWSEKNYIERQHATLTGMVGVPFLKGDKLKTMADAYFKTLKPSGHTVRMSDYDVHVSGPTAWATYTQEDLDGSGNVVSKQRGVRILEREPDGWKIVFMGIQNM